MTSLAIPFEGIIIGIGQGDAVSTTPAADTFDTIGEVVGYDFGGGETAVIDVSHAQSTFVDKLVGLPDEGSLTLTCNMVPANAGQVSARTARASRQLRNIKITLTDSGATEIDVKAYVTSFGNSSSVGEKVEQAIGFELTGQATYA